jgi:hypothetical protein
MVPRVATGRRDPAGRDAGPASQGRQPSRPRLGQGPSRPGHARRVAGLKGKGVSGVRPASPRPIRQEMRRGRRTEPPNPPRGGTIREAWRVCRGRRRRGSHCTASGRGLSSRQGRGGPVRGARPPPRRGIPAIVARPARSSGPRGVEGRPGLPRPNPEVRERIRERQLLTMETTSTIVVVGTPCSTQELLPCAAP